MPEIFLVCTHLTEDEIDALDHSASHIPMTGKCKLSGLPKRSSVTLILCECLWKVVKNQDF